MKKLTTISLFIFGVIVTAILIAGLVFYQNKKDSQSGNKVASTINNIISSGKSVVLNMAEISKHNKQLDCWMLINGKVYNITSYFGAHPGGNVKMLETCGTDATAAYMTQDPYATSNSSNSAHSFKARTMLNDYYIGDLNQIIN